MRRGSSWKTRPFRRLANEVRGPLQGHIRGAGHGRHVEVAGTGGRSGCAALWADAAARAGGEEGRPNRRPARRRSPARPVGARPLPGPFGGAPCPATHLFLCLGEAEVVKENEMLMDAALDYCRRGWSVIPLCNPRHRGPLPAGHHHAPSRNGKVPLLPWEIYQSEAAHEALVKEWW